MVALSCQPAQGRQQQLPLPLAGMVVEDLGQRAPRPTPVGESGIEVGMAAGQTVGAAGAGLVKIMVAATPDTGLAKQLMQAHCG